MGCGASANDDGTIRMKKTKLPDVDKFFDEVQGVADAIYDIKDPIDDNKDKLLFYTDLHRTECANSHHATVGLVFSMASKSPADELPNLFKTTTQQPFIEINKRGAAADDIRAVEYLMDYIKALVAAKDKIEPLSEKAQALAKKAADMPNKAKSDIEKAGSLGAMDKLNAGRYTVSNANATAKLPGLCKELQTTITNSLAEIQAAAKELGEKQSKLGEIRQKCIDAKCKSAKDCYLTCGNKIETSPDKVKEWKAQSKKSGGKKKKAAPTKK